jgi:2-dehydropantoate 2-reductase
MPEEDRGMRVAVIGAGGTGGYFGGLLARAGHDVVFVARGAHLDAMRRSGLTVRSRLAGDFTVPARVTERAEEHGPVDLILFCVKAYDTRSAAALLPPLVGPETMILSVQNGIDNETQIAEAVGPAHVLGAVAQVSSIIEAPGVIAQTAGPGKIIFGEMEGDPTARVERLRETLQQAGIAAEARGNMRAALWEKFVFICGVSGVTSLTRLPLGPILADQETRALLRGTMAEAESVGRAEGVAIAPAYTDRALSLVAGLEPWMRGSMYYDLAAGRRLELDTLNGAVVRLGRGRGIPTPFNVVIYAALRPYIGGPPAAP